YSMKHVLASVAMLEPLRKLAEELGGPSSRRPSDEAAVAKVVELIGDGPLAAELRRAFAGTPEPAPVPEPAPASAKSDGDPLVGELLERHETRQVDTKRAVDS